MSRHASPTSGEKGRAAPFPTGARRLLPVAVSATGRHMFLHFMAIGDALISMHGLPTDMRGAMKQRLSAFQRMGFPLPSRLKAKAQLSLDDALKIVFAFQLLEIGMSPSRAARVTASDWDLIREAIAVAWAARSERSRGEPAGSHADGPAEELVIAPHALAEFGAKESTEGALLSETLGLQDASHPPVRGGKGAFSTIRIDVGTMVDAFGGALANTGFSPKDDFDGAMRLFAESAGADADRGPGENDRRRERART